MSVITAVFFFSKKIWSPRKCPTSPASFCLMKQKNIVPTAEKLAARCISQIQIKSSVGVGLEYKNQPSKAYDPQPEI